MAFMGQRTSPKLCQICEEKEGGIINKAILIMGESGSGKTTSLRNLPPGETYYIDCDKRGLSWKGWREQYNSQKKNYKATDLPEVVSSIISGIDQKCPHIKYIVVDTLNGIMVGNEMRRIKEKGYDKWSELAQSIWGLVDGAYTYRDDLTLIFTAHCQTERDEFGYVFTRMKTNGRKLEKVQVESKFTTVLLAKADKEGYFFLTRDPASTCKTPLGAFESDKIENDIMLVIRSLQKY